MPVEIQQLPWCKPYIKSELDCTEGKQGKTCAERSKEVAGLPSRCWFVDKQTKRTPCVKNAAGQEIQIQSKWWEFSQRRIMFWVVHWFSQYWKHILGLVGCFAELEQWSLPLMAKQEESDFFMLPARHVQLGLSRVLVYPLVYVFASLHANRLIEASQSWCWVCISEVLGAGGHCLPAVTCWHPLGAHLGTWLLLGLSYLFKRDFTPFFFFILWVYLCFLVGHKCFMA